MLALNCLIVNDGSVVTVTIQENQRVGELKDVIKGKIECSTLAKNLLLWQVEGKLEETKAPTVFLYDGNSVAADEIPQQQEILLASKPLSEYFSQPAVGFIHVLVQVQETPPLQVLPDEIRMGRLPSDLTIYKNTVRHEPPTKKQRVFHNPAMVYHTLRLLDKLDKFNQDVFDLNSVVDVPFPSLLAPPYRFRLHDDNRCFSYQARTDLKPLYETIVKRWFESRRAVVNFAGTVGYGKSHILAVLTVLLLKNRTKLMMELTLGDETIRLCPWIIYIPDCRALLLQQKVLLILQQNILLNCPQYDGPLDTAADIALAFSKHEVILIADQWNSIDEDNDQCQTAQKNLADCFRIPAMVTIHGMAMNSMAWRRTHHKQTSEVNMCFTGGFNAEEFGVWMQHQNNALLRDNEEELVLLTGRVPLLLDPFARLYEDGDTWESLVQRVLQAKPVKDLKKCIETFYEPFDANVIWDVYSHLVPPSIAEVSDHRIDHRFFYHDGTFSAIGDIATRLLYFVWRNKVADDQILGVWKSRLRLLSNPSVRGFFVAQIVKAVVLRDGVCGNYPKEERSIVKFSLIPGHEEQALCEATRIVTGQMWILLDPEIFNYGGVDMILITDTTIVGINVTIAKSHRPMTYFFDVWDPLANTHKMLITGLFIAPDGFTSAEPNVQVAHLKNVYNELWDSIKPSLPIPDYACGCKTDCSTACCGCKKHDGKRCNQKCSCVGCTNKI